MKYILFLVVILAVGCCFLFSRVRTLENLNNALNAEKSALIDEIKRRNENVLALSKQKAELEKAAAQDKTNFDWHYDISGSPVIKRLQSNKKRRD